MGSSEGIHEVQDIQVANGMISTIINIHNGSIVYGVLQNHGSEMLDMRV
jgi:hypothetical protein